MKAWVIKQDNGNYILSSFAFTNTLCDAYMCEKEQDAVDVAKKYGGTVVPITVVEGDLETENKQLKQQIEEVNNSGFVWEGKARAAWDEIEILEKALELACEELMQIGGDCCGCKYGDCSKCSNHKQSIIDSFIFKAKEALKDE